MAGIPKKNLPRQDAEAFRTFYDTVVDICSYMGDDEAKTLFIKVSRFLRLALEELNLYLFVHGVKSVVLKINDNMTVDLPRDFQTMGKVGVCCSNGTIRFIGRNDKLCAPKDVPLFECCDCNKGVKTEEELSALVAPEECCAACTFHNVEGIGKSRLGSELGINGLYHNYLYGYNPQMFRNGTYRLDETNHRIILGDGCDTMPGKEIIVEYNAAMTDDRYDLIPIKAVPTLMYKTAAMIKANKNPNASNFEFRQFKVHYRQLKKTYETWTLEDLVASLRKGYRSSPKR